MLPFCTWTHGRETLTLMIDAVDRHVRTLDASIARGDLVSATIATRALRAAVATLDARTIDAALSRLEASVR